LIPFDERVCGRFRFGPWKRGVRGEANSSREGGKIAAQELIPLIAIAMKGGCWFIKFVCGEDGTQRGEISGLLNTKYLFDQKRCIPGPKVAIQSRWAG